MKENGMNLKYCRDNIEKRKENLKNIAAVKGIKRKEKLDSIA